MNQISHSIKIMMLLLVMMSAVFLSGCGTTKPKTVEITNIKMVPIPIPDVLLEPCKPNKPITVDEYLKLNVLERETYLTNYSIDLMVNLSDCNKKLKSIKELRDENQSGH